MTAPRYISVVDYRTAAVLYCGTGEWRAAQMLEPGTVFGTGSSPRSATDHAMRRLAAQQGAIKTAVDDHGSLS